MAREVVEVTPLVAKSTTSPSPQDNVVYHTLKVLGLISLWYFFSTLLSLLNKHLVGREGIEGKGRFPAPLLMTGVQFCIQFILARVFLDVGLVSRSEKHEERTTWTHYFKTGVITSIGESDIGFSNLSLRTISLSFYTMCKSTTPMFLLLFAFLWQLEKPSCHLFGIMLVISGGILLLVYGETKFNFTGFSLVMTAACLAGLRWTLTQLLLQGNRSAKNSRADGAPLELLEKLTPIMSAVVLLVSVFFESWHRLPNSPYFEDVEQSLITFVMITALGVIAFLMVWTEFTVIKETSALTFMVAGTCKEIVTVMAAVVFFHDEFGPINAFGLVVLVFGVSLFNVYKYKKLQMNQELHRHDSPNHEASQTATRELTQLTMESHSIARRV